LRQEQEALGTYFAKRPEDRHGGVEYTYTMTAEGVPLLADAMAFFACQVVGSHVYGDHTIYVGEVKKVLASGSGTPLLFFRSRWYRPAEQ
jgi:flavin reductase (DIM6/NTAB) family NADH-FMN oxidoreductase RutF